MSLITKKKKSWQDRSFFLHSSLFNCNQTSIERFGAIEMLQFHFWSDKSLRIVQNQSEAATCFNNLSNDFLLFFHMQMFTRLFIKTSSTLWIKETAKQTTSFKYAISESLFEMCSHFRINPSPASHIKQKEKKIIKTIFLCIKDNILKIYSINSTAVYLKVIRPDKINRISATT